MARTHMVATKAIGFHVPKVSWRRSKFLFHSINNDSSLAGLLFNTKIYYTVV